MLDSSWCSKLYTHGQLTRIAEPAQSLSQGQLAEAVGVSRQTINAIETGRLPALTSPCVIALARFFSSTVEKIFDADSES